MKGNGDGEERAKGGGAIESWLGCEIKNTGKKRLSDGVTVDRAGGRIRQDLW